MTAPHEPEASARAAGASAAHRPEVPARAPAGSGAQKPEAPARASDAAPALDEADVAFAETFAVLDGYW